MLQGFLNVSTVRAVTLAAAVVAGFCALKKNQTAYIPLLPKIKAPKHEVVAAIDFDEEDFVSLLRSLLAHVKDLQNSPTLTPREDLAADIVIEYLKPYTAPNGPLKVRKVTYVEGRSNVIIEYPGETEKVVSFVGSHMDVVPATPADWSRDPFKLTVEGDMLYGRGVTDCLGHVALISQFFKHLAIKSPKLKVGVAAVFISNEENTANGAGIDALESNGELKFLKDAPLFWVDSANIGPTMGTGGVQVWKLTASGKGFHSGFPNKAINAIPLATEAIKYIQSRFYKDFPHREDDVTAAYKFILGSSMKPTGISTPPASANIIPRTCTVTGDIRFTPFYRQEDVRSKVESYVRDLNEHIIRRGLLPGCTGYDAYVIREPSGEAIQGLIEFEWDGDACRGVACDLTSVGFKAICDAINDVCGEVKPFSLTGSLPIIADLKDQGYDVQVCGFGYMDAYHAVNEYATISGFRKGARILASVLASLDSHL